jgi:hypothetical protein
MPASKSTAEAVIDVFARHGIDLHTQFIILRDLRRVEGNRSYRNTIQRLYSVVERHMLRDALAGPHRRRSEQLRATLESKKENPSAD